MPISKNAQAVLERRYLIRDEKGNPTETVDDLFHRVAGAIAAADRVFDEKADVDATAADCQYVTTPIITNTIYMTFTGAQRPLKKREEIHPQTMVPGMPAYSNSENATRL